MMDLSTLLALFGLPIIMASYWAWLRGAFAWTRRRKLAHFQRRRAWLTRLHESDRAYYGWLLSGVLLVLAMLALVLASDAFLPPPDFWSPDVQLLVSSVFRALRYALGMAAYVVAMACFQEYKALEHFDDRMAALDQRIAELERRIASSVAPAAP